MGNSSPSSSPSSSSLIKIFIDINQFKIERENKKWVIFNDYVLDITDYISIHPGGRVVLLSFIGQDISEIFDKYCHTNKAYEIAIKLKIGEIRK